MLYSLSDFLFDGVESTVLAEDWFLHSGTDISAGELTLVTASAA